MADANVASGQSKLPFTWARHGPVILIGGLYLYASGLMATRVPLWHDELFSYYVAQLGGPRTIVEALLAKADNHPPLDYIFRHYGMSLFGDSALAFRMPSILALLVAALCLYAIVLRRGTISAALAAFSLPFTTVAFRYSYEGRSYAILVATMCIAFLAWQMATERISFSRLLLLTAALCIAPFCHYYGILNFLPVAVGETWRSWERRAICWPIVMALLAAIIPLALLIPFVVNASEYTTRFWSGLGPSAPFFAYASLLETTVPAFAVSLILCTAVTLFPCRAAGPVTHRDGLRPHEIAAAVVICLLPFTTYVVALLITRAYTYKYLLTTIVGITLLVGHLVGRVGPINRVIIAASLSLWAVTSLLYNAHTAPSRSFSLADSVVKTIRDARLPLVVPNYDRFLTTYFYLPKDLKNKIFYLGSVDMARRYGNNTTIDFAFHNLSAFVPINVPDFCPFIRAHPQFLLLAGGKGWFMQMLADNDRKIRLVSGSLLKNPIFSVTLPHVRGC